FDFAGQDHYKPLHQFFYSNRSLYVLVTRNGDESNDFDFWLDTAQLFGGGSPVLVVNNLFGDVPSQFNRSKFERFDDIIKESLSVNLETMNGWANVQKSIEHWAEWLPHVQEFIPKSWANVRRALLSRRVENILSVEEYFKICALPENGGMDEERALHCSEYLHDIGICLHYQKNDLLNRLVIVKNEWATEAVYRVIDDEQIGNTVNCGRFNWDDLRRIWTGDYAKHRPELLEMMKIFRLCYPLPDGQAFIAPQRLPITPPEGYVWKPDNDLQLYVEYEFMPPGLLSRLIVQCHPIIAQERSLVWRDGAVLHWHKAEAEITLFKREGRQTISIRAQGEERRELLTFVDRQLDILHGDTKGIRLEKKIPCICSKCAGRPKPWFFNLSILENRKANHRPTIECEVSFEPVSIEQLLGNIFAQVVSETLTKSQALTTMSAPVKIFISYSHQDEDLKKEFQTRLAKMKRDGKITYWQDRELLPGAAFSKEIAEKLAEAQIVCLLISPDFMASEYCFSIEMEQALRKYEAGNGRIVPIILRPTDDWTGCELGQFNAVPTDGKPITSQDKDTAWADVTGKIRRLVESILEKRI
ncbi:MAG: COR domain-containing protein, partial [Saprospiraceae bacterium]